MSEILARTPWLEEEDEDGRQIERRGELGFGTIWGYCVGVAQSILSPRPRQGRLPLEEELWWRLRRADVTGSDPTRIYFFLKLLVHRSLAWVPFQALQTGRRNQEKGRNLVSLFAPRERGDWEKSNR